MNILVLHNEYKAPSGEEHALMSIAQLLEEGGHQLQWFLRKSVDIIGTRKKLKAFFSGIHSPGAVKDLRKFLSCHEINVALVQNLYPLLSPSILPVLDEFQIPVIMRCPNYRLFCPTGLHLSNGKVCERCLGGKEYWCVLKNCENAIIKSTGYALRSFTARISRRITNHVSQFIVLSEFQKNRFIQNGIPKNRIKIIPNLTPKFTAQSNQAKGHLVSFVGRISPEKGITDFLAAVARLPGLPFAIAGNHEHMPGLVKTSPGNVKWLGFLKDSDLDDLYRHSRLLVFPGKWFEGFPNVITHAMAAGKPVIASRLGGVPEIVGHEKTGLLFEPGNVQELVASIQSLYMDPIRCTQMGETGRQKAERVYSRKAVYRCWDEAFRQVLDMVSHRA